MELVHRDFTAHIGKLSPFIAALVALVERRRDEYQVMAPLFWKKASRSALWTRHYYKFLLLTRRATMLRIDTSSTCSPKSMRHTFEAIETQASDASSRGRF